MITCRAYKQSDWPLIKEWWAASGEIAPVEGMMPPDSSYVADIDGTPALACSLYLTNTKELAYVENFIGNPALKGAERREAAQAGMAHVARVARELGYKRLLCMTEKPALMNRYQELGFTPTLSGVTAFVRVL
jgi:hypothetical protein